jgi:hypothetical protein
MFLGGEMGSVKVLTTQGRGSNPDELAELALDKILHIGETAHPALRAQAEAFKDAIRQVLVYYMQEAVRGNKLTVANRLREAGYSELVALLDE